MYNTTWDPDTNGVILTSDEGDVKSPVRPVFFEELDLLGFESHGITYPRVKGPLLWAAGRAYYYKGEKIALARGGGFYEDVKLKVYSEPQKLEPVDIKAVLKKNQKKIYHYSHDSIDFIRSTFEKYRDKADIITVSFSGGKDSVVVADLTKRSLNASNYVVIFSDTRLESPMTYDFVKQYCHENPGLNILKTRYHEPQPKMWEKFGPPSRIHRWCHTVYKTAPIRKKIKEYLHLDKPKILLIDGIRAEESSSRSKYNNINVGTKGMLQINVSPILDWSSLEIFLYIFNRNLNINNMYRHGYTRVGCIVCPYSSQWGEYLSKTIFNDEIQPYLNILKKNAEFAKISDIEKYITDGGWKSRSGGMDLEFGGNRAEFFIKNNNLNISIKRDSEDFWKWVSTLGPVVRKESKCQLKYCGEIYQISEKKNPNSTQYIIKGIGSNIKLIHLLKKIGYKSEYCIRCQACEAVCPTGALTIDTDLHLDTTKCNHCANCINYVEKGCWVAKSISHVGYQKVKKMCKAKITRYQGFGMETKNLIVYQNHDDWEDVSGLGINKIQGFKHWLQDAGFYVTNDKKSENTELPDNHKTELSNIFPRDYNYEDLFIWSVIWNNLSESTILVNWYTIHVPKGSYSKKELTDMIATYRELEIPNRTDRNAIDALVNTLTKSPIGEELGVGVKDKRNNKTIISKIGSDKIPDMAVLYSVYRYAERNGRKRLVASEFIKNKETSPHTAFCMDYNNIKASLTRMANQYPDLLYLEFSGNLDNIILSESITSLDIVRRYVEEHKS